MTSQRLQFVIDRLYKPLTIDNRQVFALSRSDAETLPRLPSMAVISITAPGQPPASLDGVEHLLRLCFSDVSFANPNLSDRAKTKLPDRFTPEHACQIGAFIDSLPTTVRTIVVHCAGGFSRSCAVAQGLHELYGFIVEPERLTEANPSVKAVLVQTLKELRC